MSQHKSAIFFGFIVALIVVVAGELYILNQLSEKKISTKCTQALASFVSKDPFNGRFSSDATKVFEMLTEAAGFKYINHYGTNPSQQLIVELKQEGVISALKNEDGTVSIDISDEKGKKITSLMIPENTDSIHIYAVKDISRKMSTKELKVNQKVEIIWKTDIINGGKSETMDIVTK